MRAVGQKVLLRKRGYDVEVEAVELDETGEPVVEVRATLGPSSYAMRWGVGSEGNVTPQRLQQELDRLRDAAAEVVAGREEVRANLKSVS